MRRIGAGIAGAVAIVIVALVASSAGATGGTTLTGWTWSTPRSLPQQFTYLSSLTCPSTSLCMGLAQDQSGESSGKVGDVVTTTNPLGSVPRWRRGAFTIGHKYVLPPDLITCGSPSECIAVVGTFGAPNGGPYAPGFIVATSHPRSGGGSMREVKDTGALGSVNLNQGNPSCPDAHFCAALTSVDHGPNFTTSRNYLWVSHAPTRRGSWTIRSGPPAEYSNLTCSQTALCVAFADPSEQSVSARTTVAVLSDALDPASQWVRVTANPHGAIASSAVPPYGEGFTGASCTANSCLLATNEGAIVTSTEGGEAGTWTRTVLPGLGAAPSGDEVLVADCTSVSFCAIATRQAYLGPTVFLVSGSPFAADAGAWTPTRVPLAGPRDWLEEMSCPHDGLCVAVLSRAPGFARDYLLVGRGG